MNVLGRFRWQTLTGACPNEIDTIGKVRESSSNGVMDEDSGKVQKTSTHEWLHTRDTIEIHNRKGQGKVIQRGDGRRFWNVHRASAHDPSSIVMDVAIVESHIAAVDVKTPALQNKQGKGHRKVIQRGDG